MFIVRIGLSPHSKTPLLLFKLSRRLNLLTAQEKNNDKKVTTYVL